MRILFVCQQYIHAARWINQLKDTGHEIYVFDCLDKEIHKDLLWTNYISNWSKRKILYIKGEQFLSKKLPQFYNIVEPFLKVTPSEKLIEIIKKIKPDFVHSLEMQSQTYHVLKARKKIDFKWGYFSWGSDIFLYQKKKKHQKKLVDVFSKIDYLFTDNNRDIKLAKNLGFSNIISGIFPGGGGYSLDAYKKHNQPFLNRNLILIKGYHHWAGRALKVLEALEIIVGQIKNYDVYVYSAHNIVVDKIKEMNTNYNINIGYSSRYKELSHEQLLQKFGASKIAIGNSISDGIPNTLLEAIVLGAFPIQSNPGGASEDYVIDGVNGLLINKPEDSNEIANKIILALSNDKLLISALNMNNEIAMQLDYNLIKNKVLLAYKNIEKTIK